MAQTRSSRFHKFARSRIGLPLADVILVYGYEMLAETGGVRVLLITTLLCANVPGWCWVDNISKTTEYTIGTSDLALVCII